MEEILVFLGGDENVFWILSKRWDFFSLMKTNSPLHLINSRIEWGNDEVRLNESADNLNHHFKQFFWMLFAVKNGLENSQMIGREGKWNNVRVMVLGRCCQTSYSV